MTDDDDDATRPADAVAVATAQALTSSMDSLASQLEASTRYGRRNRHMIWGLVVALFLIAALMVGFALVAVQANHASEKATRASDKATQVRNQQISTCLSTNEARANNRELWDHLFALTPTRPQTEAQRKQIADVKAFVAKTFAPRDCSKI